MEDKKVKEMRFIITQRRFDVVLEDLQKAFKELCEICNYKDNHICTLNSKACSIESCKERINYTKKAKEAYAPTHISTK